MTEEVEKSSESKPQRDELGRLIPGNPSINPNGRPPETPEQKAKKKALRELVEAYKEGLAEALESIKPVLVEKALTGDVSAIREINDRVMGKPQQDVTSDGEAIQPILVQFIDGNDNDPDRV